MPKIYKRNCNQCSKYYKSTAKKFCSWECYTASGDRPIMSPDGRARVSESKKGDKNPNWVGDRVKLHGLHRWVERRIPKPSLCEDCRSEPPRDLANKGTYNRSLDNWEWLCRRCHMTKDGRLKNLKQFHSSRKS